MAIDAACITMSCILTDTSFNSGQPVMPSSVNVQTRVDPAIREEADLVLKSIGLSISDVMRMTLIRIAQDKAVPFELFRPNETTIAAMRDARAGKLKRVNSVAELMADDDEDD